MPTVLDLFCGGGGAGMGYKKAGFEVIGIDTEDHKKSFSHVGEFHQMDWEEGLKKFARRADFIHASPPCQAFSLLTGWGRKENKENAVIHPKLIAPVREALQTVDKPWVIENVEGAYGELTDPILLCAWTFGYEHYRHRLFEFGGGITFVAPPHRPHKGRARSPGHRPKYDEGEGGMFHSIGGNYDSSALAHEVMDITWMRGKELSESIPPYYTNWLGIQVHQHRTRLDFIAKKQARKPGPWAAKEVWKDLMLTRAASQESDEASSSTPGQDLKTA